MRYAFPIILIVGLLSLGLLSLGLLSLGLIAYEAMQVAAKITAVLS